MAKQTVSIPLPDGQIFPRVGTHGQAGRRLRARPPGRHHGAVHRVRRPKPADFFPLTVEYREKYYAAGKIPGGYFKREAKLSDREVLTCRIIDRPLRPMFPEGYRREVQIVCTVLSADDKYDAEIIAIIGASAAIGLSHLPFEEQVAAVRVVGKSTASSRSIRRSSKPKPPTSS